MKLPQTATHTLAIFAGGSLGAFVRCCVCLLVGVSFSNPLAILAINLIGSGILGFVQTFPNTKRQLVRPFWATGFCGAFTTYATFIGIIIVAESSLVFATLYAAVSLVGGIACALVGRRMGLCKRRCIHSNACKTRSAS